MLEEVPAPIEVVSVGACGSIYIPRYLALQRWMDRIKGCLDRKRLGVASFENVFVRSTGVWLWVTGEKLVTWERR
jgi:hypothetical protein